MRESKFLGFIESVSAVNTEDDLAHKNKLKNKTIHLRILNFEILNIKSNF